MITEINLLPWRKKRKFRKNMVFLSVIFFIFIVTALLFSVVYMTLKLELSEITEDNNRLLELIAKKNKVLGDVVNLQKNREDFRKKLSVIKNVELIRDWNVKLLIMIAKSVTPGVKLTSIQKTDSSIRIVGLSKESGDVIDFMVNLKNPMLVKNVELVKITTRESDSKKEENQYKKSFKSTFEVIVQLFIPGTN